MVLHDRTRQELRGARRARRGHSRGRRDRDLGLRRHRPAPQRRLRSRRQRLVVLERGGDPQPPARVLHVPVGRHVRVHLPNPPVHGDRDRRRRADAYAYADRHPHTAPGGLAPPPPSGGTPAPQPRDDHTSTPAPGTHAGNDTVKPRIARLRLKRLRRGARLRFRLSESATVTIRVTRRGRHRAVERRRVQASAGTRRITVGDRRMKRGRYTVRLRARDAMGNRSAAVKRGRRIRW